MDPPNTYSKPGRSGFPRTGGDGPGDLIGEFGTLLLPPHGRGWTQLGNAGFHSPSASPARAGMDRHHIVRMCARGRFPRTGGDGPVMMNRTALTLQLPPHGRGWTVPVHTLLAFAAASPARAGMDLNGVNYLTYVTRFPRTGGDGPNPLKSPSVINVLPPHGRGWTIPRTATSPYIVASPARAGMDRLPGCTSTAP